jgi:activator of HSP90 ATPase
MVTWSPSRVTLSDTCSMLCVGHSALLTTALEQATDSTKVTFTLGGVPTGMEDEIRRNLEGY